MARVDEEGRVKRLVVVLAAVLLGGCGTATTVTESAAPSAPADSAQAACIAAVAAEESARIAAVEAVAATNHPDDDVWACMNDPMVIEEMPDDPDAEAWSDLTAVAEEYTVWWQQVAADPTLPWTQQE